MRKNELIKLLQDIKGNPEVVLWNGFVNDYHKIDKNIGTATLVKESDMFIRKALVCENNNRCITEQDIKKRKKETEWEVPNPYVSLEEFHAWYGKNKKSVIVLQGLPRGKTDAGRGDALHY